MDNQVETAAPPAEAPKAGGSLDQKTAQLKALVEELSQARLKEFQTELQAVLDKYGMVPVVRQDVVFVPRQQQG